MSDDPYAWLRADNWREALGDPSLLPKRIGDCLKEENVKASSLSRRWGGLEGRLYEEMRGRLSEAESGVPESDGDWEYVFRYPRGKERLQLARRRLGDEGRRRVLLDINKEAGDSLYYELGGVLWSPCHRYVAWTTDESGDERHTLRVREVGSGEDKELATGVGGELAWSRDGGLYYVGLDENLRPIRIMGRRLSGGEAEEVYKEEAEGFFVSLGRTRSGDYITASAHDHETSQPYVWDARGWGGRVEALSAREEGVRRYVDDWREGGMWVVRENGGRAEDFRIVLRGRGSGGGERVLVEHERGRPILGHGVYGIGGGWVVRSEMKDATPRLAAVHIDTGRELYVDCGGGSIGVVGVEFYEATSLRYAVSGPASPREVREVSFEGGEDVLLKRTRVPSGHRRSDYRTRRVFMEAYDGERIPVSMLWRRGTKLDGSAPLFLYGYGAYGITIPASFSVGRLSLVDRGFVYGIAHIRGGRERGERWREGGRGLNRMNTFRDFLSVAEGFVSRGWVKRGNITIHGGSAGGSLVGAALNMSEEGLFRSAIAEVPFVDVLTTMLDKTLPLTKIEEREWGDPATDEEARRCIEGWSPYDNVVRRDYPHVLATAGVSDPRVTYWEPAKWVMRLRENNTANTEIVLKTNMEAGHGGSDGRFARLKEVAYAYAFALWAHEKA